MILAGYITTIYCSAKHVYEYCTCTVLVENTGYPGYCMDMWKRKEKFIFLLTKKNTTAKTGMMVAVPGTVEPNTNTG
jgi:hypothetical protein